jgi:hypothetical protein
MQRALRNALLIIFIVASLCLACPIAWAESGILVVHVADPQGHPVVGLVIGVIEDGGYAKTDFQGKARIRLGSNTQEDSLVSLQIVACPPGTDLGIANPWNGQKVPVPSFKSDRSVEVVVMNSRDLAAMRNTTISVTLTAKIKIKKPNVPKKTNK